MTVKKTLTAELCIRSELLFRSHLTPKQMLMLAADAATTQFLRCVGQNARGDFRVLVQFKPDGGADDA